jgi:hypothetical protein
MNTQLSDDWSYPPDNVFARSWPWETEAPTDPSDDLHSSRLCASCKRMNFWSPDFRILDTKSGLDESRATCEFCSMRWDVSQHLDPIHNREIIFDRVHSMLKLRQGTVPALSMCCSPGE